VVLGSRAAARLGIDDVGTAGEVGGGGRAVHLGGEWFTVVGVLDPIPLFPNLDSAAFIGYPVAAELFGTSRSPSTVYVVSDPDVVDAVRSILAPTTSPENPNEVNVTNPSDALKAQAAVDESLNRLLLGLGAVALVVGGIGIANVMVIGVIERRSEIGVRRALGATRRHIRLQFLLEAAVLGLAGGALGVAAGAAVTVGVSRVQDTVVSVPPSAIGLGLGAALVVGALAGLSPAARAARMAPADAVRPA
jgi:putative ABC transport system permease protein